MIIIRLDCCKMLSRCNDYLIDHGFIWQDSKRLCLKTMSAIGFGKKSISFKPLCLSSSLSLYLLFSLEKRVY